MVKIGFDLDGVIADAAIFKCNKIKEIYNIDLEPWQLTSKVINTFVPNKKIRDNINCLSATTMHPEFINKNLIEILQKLIDLGAKLYIVSRRGKSDNGIEFGRNTIKELNIESFFDEIIFCETDNEKIEIIKQKQLDIFIDDRLGVIESVQKHIYFPILFDEYSIRNKGLLKYDNENLLITNDLDSVFNFAKIIKLIKNVINKLCSEKKINISPTNYKIISYVNNIVVNINNLYLKIYSNNSTIRDHELELYSQISNTELFKEIIYSGTVELDTKYRFALFKGIKGQTLDLVSYNTEQAKLIAKSVYNFIDYTSKISCSGFGDITQDFKGLYKTFREYIFEFQHKTSTTLYLNSYTKKYSILAYDLLVKYSDKFEIKNSYIIPVDLNFRNIMITDGFCVKIIDPGALVAGPLEMSYGEFCAHSYGTEIYNEFEKLIHQSIDLKLVRIYAVFMLLNILAFIIRNNTMDPRSAKPFGNNKTFFELIDEHIKFLGYDINDR